MRLALWQGTSPASDLETGLRAAEAALGAAAAMGAAALDRLHGAVFADAGNAWGPGLPVPGYEGARRDAVASMGLEVRLDALLFFSVPLQVRLGAAHRLTDGGGTSVHLRLGPPF